MTKLLPTGHYSLSVLAIGGLAIDGGLLEFRFAQPLASSFVADAARKGVPELMPKHLDELPAGSWWAVDLQYRPGCADGARAVEQLEITVPLKAPHFMPELLGFLPKLAFNLAQLLVPVIGVEAPIIVEPPAPRRQLH